MSADDQAFLDVLSSVPNDVKRYSSQVADFIERQTDRAAGALRDTIASSAWIPEAAKPARAVARSKLSTKISPPSLLQRVQDWVSEHKILTSVVVFSIASSTLYVLSQRRLYRKRRAKRAPNGARLEVVVLAGPPADPITRAMALDLERRGFIVYVVCSSIEEEVQVQSEARTDIKPLSIDLVDPASTAASMDRLAAQLQAPHYAFQGARAHYLSLKAVIVLPSINYPSAPVATISPSVLSDLLNTRLLQPVLLLQAFLPLLTSPSLRSTHATSSPRVLLLTPSIIPSLKPAFHAPESSIVAALDALAHSLRSELMAVDIPVIQLKLGTFDCSAYGAKHHGHAHSLQSQRAETLTWPESARQAYARNYIAQAGRHATTKGCGQLGSVTRGSSLRQLHYAVFDAMEDKQPALLQRIGRGSQLYSFIGAWAPRGLVARMMGLRRVEPVVDMDMGALSVVPAEHDYVSVHGYRDPDGF